jgi:hypothetical protein
MCRKAPYSFIGATYTSNKQLMLDSNCNGITVINKGNTIVYFNGVELLPSLTAGQTGESLSIGGNSNEILNSRLDISFVDGTNPKAIVIQKYYNCG